MLKYQLAILADLSGSGACGGRVPTLPPGMFININFDPRRVAPAAEVPDSNVPDVCVATGSMLFSTRTSRRSR